MTTIDLWPAQVVMCSPALCRYLDILAQADHLPTIDVDACLSAAVSFASKRTNVHDSAVQFSHHLAQEYSLLEYAKDGVINWPSMQYTLEQGFEDLHHGLIGLGCYQGLDLHYEYKERRGGHEIILRRI